MERLGSADYRIRDQMMIQCVQLPAMGAGKRQQVSVRHLAGVEQARCVDTLHVEKARLVRPELVATQAAQIGTLGQPYY